MATEKANKQEISISHRGQEAQRITPARLLSPFEEMDRIFENFFSRGWLQPFQWRPRWGELAMPLNGNIPHVDVIDRDNEIVVRAEVPGVDKKDLDVSMTDNTITIKGETKYEEEEEKGDYYRCELTHGAFARTIPLPGAVDASKAKATYHEGVLEMNLPKLEKSKRHSIKVE